jgi:hypothetical protein
MASLVIFSSVLVLGVMYIMGGGSVCRWQSAIVLSIGWDEMHSMKRVSNEGIIPVRKELFVIFITCLAEFSSKANHFFFSLGRGKGG